MATTLFHWTLHPWAIYAVVGLAIAYSTFRKRRRQTISAVFTPLIGERHANGAAGRVIDILAIFATLFGSAASLGLGALQIGCGIQELDWMEKVGTGLLVAIIAVLTVGLRRLRGLRRGEGHPVAVQHQHGAGPAPGRLRLRRRPHHPRARPAAHLGLSPTSATCPSSPAAPRRPAAARAWPTGSAAGPSSTGRGGSPGRPSSACSSPASAAAAPSASSSAASSSCPARSACLVRRLRRLRR